MRGGERVGERDADLEERRRREPAAGQQPIERSPLDQLHRDERHGVCVLDREDRDDVGVIEGGNDAGFVPKAGKALGIGGDVGGEYLERGVAAKPRIVRAIDVAHASGTQGRQNLVASDVPAVGEVHGGTRILPDEAHSLATAASLFMLRAAGSVEPQVTVQGLVFDA